MSDDRKTTTLEELVGAHLLSGVQPGTRPRGEYQDEDPDTLTVVLDDVAYMIIEDPSDGYRSSMQDIEIADITTVTNRFQPVKVTATMRVKKADEYHQPEIIDITDDATGKIVLSLGTGDADDYYPYFVADWHPENLILNAGIEK